MGCFSFLCKKCEKPLHHRPKPPEKEPMKFITFIVERYDEETDIQWGTFQTEDNVGKVDFEIPINKGDFEIGKNYKITFTKYEQI